MHVAFDIETTGLTNNARIVELAAIQFGPSGRPFASYASLVNPGCRLPRIVTRITGITPQMLRIAPSARTVLRDFLAWLPDPATLIAHNADFDRSVLERELRLADFSYPGMVQWIDTLPMARRLLKLEQYRLSSIARSLNWDVDSPVHRATQDADLVRRLYLQLSANGAYSQV